LAEVDFLSRWEKVQHIELDYCSQSIEAVLADDSVTKLLDVQTGTPVLKESNIVYVTGGMPAGLFITFYRSDVFRFEATVDFKARRRIARLA
jgi:GntR family transcriptional regulator